MSYNYGLWLYKEVATSYGLAKIEIYDANYTGNPIEIDALSANSIILSVSNLSSISSPVQKSQLSFSIIDTQQFDYSVFFTPDARKYKVVLKTQIKGESYVTRWSGYLTPDSYIEELQYRSTIDLIARDNIGLLNDYTFDYVPTDISNNVESVRNIILGAFAKIDDAYPMEILFRTEKCSVGNDVQESILVIDSMVNCYQMYDKTWGEVIEMLLHDLGLQLRFIDNNRIAIYDLSQINNLNGDGANKSIRFLEGSGIREIMPAWREVNIEQDYGIIDDFYIGEIDSEDKLEYVKASSFNRNISLYEPAEITHWKRENDIYLLNFLNILNNYVDDNKINSLYITGAKASVSDADILTNRLIYTQKINPIDKQITISFSLNDTLREPNDTVYSRGDGNPYVYLPYGTIGRTRTPLVYQIKYRFNIFLIGDDGNTYIMRDKWVNANSELEDNFIEFTTKKLQIYATNNISEDGANRMRFTQYNNEEEYSIVINTIPVAGKLQFVIYPYTFLEDSYADIRDVNTFERGAKISDIKFSVETESKGLESIVSINPNHNIKGKESFIYGEVPAGQGDFLLYTGGLFYPGSLETINGFKLPNRGNGSTYHLLELVNREIIHYSKKNYNLLSGSLDYEDNIPLMFNHILLREGKTFLIKDASLNIIQNIINITSAQEVEDYADGSFTQINSPVSSGSVNLGGGGNIAMQFSSDAGNAKRIYELDTATDEELSGAYIILDKAGLPSAKKYSLQSIADTLDWFELRTLETGTKILFTKYTLVSALDQIAGGVGEGGSSSSGAAYNRLDTWENYNENAGDVLSALLGYGLKEQIEEINNTLASGVLSSVTVKIGDVGYKSVAGVVSLPAYPVVPNKLSGFVNDAGYITSDIAAKTYATQAALNSVNGKVESLRTEFNALNALLNNDVSGKINTWNEVVDFLNEYSESDDLATILAGINGDITTLQGRFNGEIAKQAAKVSNALTFGSKSYDGSVAQEITAADLGALPASDIYDWAKAATKPTYTWSEILSKPTTLSGYGITDAVISPNGPSGTTIQDYCTANQSFMGMVSVSDTWTHIISSRHRNGSGDGNNYGIYISADISSSNLIWERQYAGQWQGQRTILDSVSYTDYTYGKTDIDTKLAKYLPLSGGTLTGALSAPQINITSQNAISHLSFGRAGGNFITAPTGGYLAFIAEGKGIATASADLVVTDSIVYPGTDGVTQLGFGGKRWSKVSSIDGEFAGALTAGTFSTANVVSCGGRLRINASNSVTSFGFLKATAYASALNVGVLDIGTNYGGTGTITSEAMDVVAMSMYRGAVGVGRAFTYDELCANRASNVMLSVAGNINNVGDIVSTGEQVAGSDMRYKIVKSKFRLSSAIIAHAPLFRFKWKNRETTKLKIGTSAQYWEEFAPELVTFDSVSDFKHLNYAGLGVAIGISNAREIEQLKKEIVSLKERLSKYEHN